jgi:catechol 2,3-dioxygenase-like lactoylglutathione lyase family enzyme
VAIVGAHIVLYTPQAEKLREVFREVFGWRYVDDGEGWLIFALPPAELGVHPSEESTHHELSFMCDDVEATKTELEGKGIEFQGEPQDLGFGIGVTMALPGGVEALLYQPKHQTAI